VDDADAIERVRTDTWRDAYRGLVPEPVLVGTAGKTPVRWPSARLESTG
jgi:hypothetical protein